MQYFYKDYAYRFSIYNIKNVTNWEKKTKLKPVFHECRVGIN